MALTVATSASTDATGTTIAATQPASIADGDVLLAFVAKSSNTAPTTVPSGWTLGTSSPFLHNTTAGQSLFGNLGAVGWHGVYFKVAASESGTYTWGQAASTTWNVQILRLTGFRAPKPGGSVLSSILFMDAAPVLRSSTTLSDTANGVPRSNVWSEGALMIGWFVQCVAAATATFSALSASLTTIANSNQTAVSQLVSWEYVDMTSNPNFGNRQLTTNQASGSTGGFILMLPDPSAITGQTVDKRFSRRRPSLSRVVNK